MFENYYHTNTNSIYSFRMKTLWSKLISLGIENIEKSKMYQILLMLLLHLY